MSGYLRSTSTDALDDDALTDVLCGLVVGTTGLDVNLVRPRWQPQPPTQPPPTVDWCAIGITSYNAADYPEVSQDTDTTLTQHRLEFFDAIASFYGPHSSSNAGAFRDAVYLPWNHLLLERQGVKLRGAEDITHLPELVNSQYIPRSDVPIKFTRMVNRVYASPAIAHVPDAHLNVVINADNGDSVVVHVEE